ncbi:hypothetical protein C3L33_13614, partial [Rhododendron williamsianum]
MNDVLSVESKAVDLSRDTWFRMKIGTYKRDLAKGLSRDQRDLDMLYSLIESSIKVHVDIALRCIRGMDLNLLENLATSATDGRSDKMVSDLQLKLAIHHNVLLCVVHWVAEVQLLDNSSFTIFDKFASLWMNMKVKVRTKQEHEAQQFRFKPRTFKIDSIIESDTSSPVGSLPNETQSEWQEWLSEEVIAGKVMILFSMSSLPVRHRVCYCSNKLLSPMKKSEEEDDALEEWNSMQDSMNNMVHVHNQLFGSMDLVQTKILDVIEMILAIPLSTPLAKKTEGLRDANKHKTGVTYQDEDRMKLLYFPSNLTGIHCMAEIEISSLDPEKTVPWLTIETPLFPINKLVYEDDGCNFSSLGSDFEIPEVVALWIFSMLRRRKLSKFLNSRKRLLKAQALEMVESMKNVAKLDVERTEEGKKPVRGYKNVIGAWRASWHIMSSIDQKEESKGNDHNVKIIKGYRQKVEEELSKICNDILTIIDKHLVPSFKSGEATVFYYKM